LLSFSPVDEYYHLQRLDPCLRFKELFKAQEIGEVISVYIVSMKDNPCLEGCAVAFRLFIASIGNKQKILTNPVFFSIFAI